MQAIDAITAEQLNVNNPRCNRGQDQTTVAPTAEQLNVKNQEKYHEIKTFKEELIELLKKNRVEYEENMRIK